MSVASIDTMLSQLQNLSIKKGEKMVVYGNRLQKLVCELDAAWCETSDIEQMRALIRGLLSEYKVTTEAEMGIECSFHDAVTRVITKETRLQQKTDKITEALLMRTSKATRSCYKREKRGHLAKDCRQGDRRGEKGSSRQTRNHENRKCFKFGGLRHIARNCPVRDDKHSGEPGKTSGTETVMMIILSALMSTASE